jgi:GNAT superfamily N-acetyltransferase
MKIRNATGKDSAGIVSLSARFVREVPTWGLTAITEDEISKADKSSIWVAEENDRLSGYAICVPHGNDASCIYKKTDKVLELKEIYLVPGARNKGIGSQFLQIIEKYAGAQGYTKLFIYSSVQELDPVIKFYRGNGFKTWAVQMFKEIK